MRLTTVALRTKVGPCENADSHGTKRQNRANEEPISEPVSVHHVGLPHPRCRLNERSPARLASRLPLGVSETTVYGHDQHWVQGKNSTVATQCPLVLIA